MSSKFKAWLRVSPSPTTLAESSAIFKQLKSQGQVQGFRKALQSEPASQPPVNDESTLFCATFAHEPLHLRTTFDVAVYHDLVDPKDADPYNIRGLQKRKPFPAPKTFSCALEKVESDEKGGTHVGRDDNPWRGHFLSKKDHWFQTVLEETGAPPGIARGLSVVEDTASDEDVKSVLNDLLEKSRAQGKRIEMNTLMKLWHDAVKPPTGYTANVQHSELGTGPSSQLKKTDD